MEEKKRGRPFNSKGLRPELKSMAYMIVHGASRDEIKKAFRLTDTRTRILMTSTEMEVETERLRAQIYGNPSQRIKHILPEAIETEYGIMTDESVKPNTRHAVAKMFIEQQMGKPKQFVQLDGGFTIRNLFEKLDAAQKPEPVPIEVESVEENLELPPAREDSKVDDFMKDFDRNVNNDEE